DAAPGLRLKKRALGEPGVFLVWGPLMVGGTYFSATGHLPWQVLADSIPYGAGAEPHARADGRVLRRGCRARRRWRASRPGLIGPARLDPPSSGLAVPAPTPAG